MRHLGNAIHTLQDLTSPVHEGEQVYKDNPASAILHGSQENHYPKADDPRRKLLEGATRWAFEMAATGNIPDNPVSAAGYPDIP